MQVAYIVKDLEKSLDYWVNVMKAGPFYVADHQTDIQIYRGKPTACALTAAVGYCGDMQIELIRLNNDAPTVFREGLDKNGEGFHHVFTVVKDYDAEIEKYAQAGCEVVYTSSTPRLGRIAMVDARSMLGSFVELVEYSDYLMELIDGLEATHLDWDGSDPIRHSAAH
jgi:catechol 2,3-dioxygenase-like lactoylglutathione lyase family enzyme